MSIKRITIICIIVAILAFAAAGMYAGTLYLLFESKNDLAIERERIIRIRMEEKERGELIRASSEIEAARDELRSYMIAEDDIVDFLARIERIGAAQGAVVRTASLSVVESGGLTDELHLSIKASGSFRAVADVLALLEVLPYKTYIEHALIEQHMPDQTGSGEWEGTFDIVVAKRIAL